MDFPYRLKSLRHESGISQQHLADHLNVSQNAVHNWETGNREPNLETIRRIAAYFSVSAAYLIAGENPREVYEKGTAIQIFDYITAKTILKSSADGIDTEEISQELAHTGTFFGLKIHGDAMEPRIKEGDTVIVRQQNDAESGDIVLVADNGKEAACRRLRKYRDGIELITDNPGYKPAFFNNEEIKNKAVQIIGRVVELRAKF